MLDILSERPMTLTDAAKALPPMSGRRIHASTIFRWCIRGVGGVRLEHARLGRKVVTSMEALNRFAQRRAEAELRRLGRSPADRDVAHEEADRELAAEGI